MIASTRSLLTNIILKENILTKNILKSLTSYSISRNVHSTPILSKEVRQGNQKLQIKELLKDEGNQGENTINIDNLTLQEDVFPNLGFEDELFHGIRFKDLPLVNIKVSKNNTIMTLTLPSRRGIVFSHTCGIEGFKNCRKGTNVAAQQTGVTFATKMLERGHKVARIRVRGLGPGRMASIKGMELGGLTMVSISDDTRVSWNPLRPRKPRRL